MNITEKCINEYNPPHGHILNSDGYAVPSPSVISADQASFLQPTSMVHINSTTKSCHVGMVQLPPLPNATYIVPPSVN